MSPTAALAKTDRFVKLRKMDTTRTDAVPISDVPTTTANPERPRTIAAGFDPLRETMTIVFRDGTYYNYYGVSQDEWGVFRRARSKGGKYGPIEQFLNAKRRGEASSADQSSDVQEVLYRIARTAQLIYRGSKQVPKTAAQGRPSYGVRAKQEQFRRYTSAGTKTTATGRRYSVSRTPTRYGKPK